MILTVLGILMLLILSVVIITVVGAIGSLGIIVFGDVIVCMLFIGWLIKRKFKKK